MADGKKSIFKRPEQTSAPTLSTEAERFIHGTAQSQTVDQAEPELKPRSTGMTAQTGEAPEEQEPTKRLTIDIPLSLHKRVKSQCANRGTTIAEMVRRYLEKTFPDQESGRGG